VQTVLFDPDGSQTVGLSATDANGSLTQTLKPPGGQWKPGQYRWVFALADGKSFSATFVASDGSPHLYAEPSLPSPTSAFNFIGTGLPINSSVELQLLLTGGQGRRTLQANTDGDGTFSLFVWPQEFGLGFFAAGAYKIEAPALQLATDFLVREHPASSTVSMDTPVLPRSIVALHFAYYAPQRYIWGIYADLTGRPVGEFLVGPTTPTGGLDSAVVLPDLAPGQYLLATPYDWGETDFTVDAPPPTATSTPSPSPTVTATDPPAAESVPAVRVCTRSQPRHHHRPRGCPAR